MHTFRSANIFGREGSCKITSQREKKEGKAKRQSYYSKESEEMIL
jgi:hypothetical protein